jgi:Na+/H+-dicarboxylate symporter/ABC-type amino acid transport substrate-binding protein
VSLSKQILLALFAGVAIGLFFGERVAFMEIGGRAFVQLLQITVLPYVVGSLIAGFGSLGRREAGLVFTRGGALLAVIWALTLGLVFLSPLALPSGKGGAFYASAPQEAERQIDWVNLYIPANPFNSLANNVVPAVVVFAVLAGVALMGMPNKAALLQPVAVFNEAMGRVGALVTKTTPFGIFAIAAHTAGTMRLEEFERLQAFLIEYAGFACFLTFWLLPGLVAATTHVRHRRLVSTAQNALLTAFVTSNYFVVLPLLTQQARELLAEAGERDETEDDLVEVLVPTSFNFPHAAKVLSIAFVPFVAWYAGMPLDPRQYPALAGAGLLSVFGSINSAIPFLLDLVRIPADHFRLFVVSGVLNSRFGSMTAAMHTLVIAILGTCMITGRARLQKARILRFAVASLAIVAVFLAGTRLLLARVLPEPATRAEVLAAIKPRPPLAPATLLRELPAPPEPPPEPGRRLEEIVRSGRLRVGFDGDSVPWAFLNAQGEAVGFDAEMAHQLALALGVRLEHVVVPRGRFAEALANGTVDIVMSGTRATARRTGDVTFSRPYAEEAIAFLVEDHRRGEFSDVAELSRRSLRIAVIGLPEWMEALKRALPSAEVVPVASPLDFVEGRVKADALLTSWERACAWSLLYPQLAPALPQPRPGNFSLSYALPKGEPELLNMVDTFVDVARAAGRLDSARAHWIEGAATRAKQPRWSIARDVLGWWKE